MKMKTFTVARRSSEPYWVDGYVEHKKLRSHGVQVAGFYRHELHLLCN